MQRPPRSGLLETGHGLKWNGLHWDAELSQCPIFIKLDTRGTCAYRDSDSNRHLTETSIQSPDTSKGCFKRANEMGPRRWPFGTAKLLKTLCRPSQKGYASGARK